MGDALPCGADEFRADLGAVPPFDPAAAAGSGVPRQQQTEAVGDIAGRIDHNPDAGAGQLDEPAGPHRESVVEADPRLAADRRAGRLSEILAHHNTLTWLCRS